jgi:mitogen-activated protein kinase kinase kinase
MAMLASKPAYQPPSLGSSTQPSAQYNSSLSGYRNHGSSRTDTSLFASPTESEFSENYDAPDAIR